MRALVDSAVWIDWLRRRRTPATATLETLLSRGEAWVAPVILQEIYQGARDQRQLTRLQQLFSDLLCVPHTHECHARAGAIYARCRWQGITPRSPHDCLIAVTATTHDLPLLHDDKDFAHLATCLDGLHFFTT